MTSNGGAPTWLRLGTYTDQCWGPGCGYTGWIRSNYTIEAEGAYQLVFA